MLLKCLLRPLAILVVSNKNTQKFIPCLIKRRLISGECTSRINIKIRRRGWPWPWHYSVKTSYRRCKNKQSRLVSIELLNHSKRLGCCTLDSTHNAVCDVKYTGHKYNIRLKNHLSTDSKTKLLLPGFEPETKVTKYKVPALYPLRYEGGSGKTNNSNSILSQKGIKIQRTKIRHENINKYDKNKKNTSVNIGKRNNLWQNPSKRPRDALTP